jgi:hypothetical protein
MMIENAGVVPWGATTPYDMIDWYLVSLASLIILKTRPQDEVLKFKIPARRSAKKLKNHLHRNTGIAIDTPAKFFLC